MAPEEPMYRCRKWYAMLLRLYPARFRERFGDGMQQTFNDLCSERVRAGRGMFLYVLWMFLETSVAILRETATSLLRRTLQRGPILFLKLAISMVALAAVAACLIVLPQLVTLAAARQRPGAAFVPWLFLVHAYAMALPFFVGLYQAFDLLSQVDMNRAFSESSAAALRRLKYAAISISVLMAAGIVMLMILARGKNEDIAGIVAMALMITAGSGVVAAVAAVLQRRVQKALVSGAD